MDKADRRNLDIAGVGSASGGQYNHVRLQGVGKVNGDIDCISCDVDGVSKMIGSVTAEQVGIRGKAKVNGDISADQVTVEGASWVGGSCTAKQQLVIRGHATVGQNVSADAVIVEGSNKVGGFIHGRRINISGRTRIGGNATAETLTLQGIMHVHGDCQAEVLHGDGHFKIGGLLNANNIKLRLSHGNSTVKEIGCETIQVNVKSGLFRRMRRLTVDIIEGDDIFLENTTANIVRGNKVTLGHGTRVNFVEYRSELLKVGNPVIGETKKQ